MENNNTASKAFDFKNMVNEADVTRMMDMPVQAVNLMVETTRKVQEASTEYFQQVERIQREYWQGMTKVMSTALPGESKLWDAQVKMVESGFDMVDRMMAVGKKA